MRIGKKIFKADKTYIMGILNVTPDSFSDGGRFNDIGKALKRVEEMTEEGADIIDIGGESARPGYTKISDDEEIARICPIIREIKKNFDICVSADTYKSSVAAAAAESGADMINDIWGLKYDDKMPDIIKRYDMSCVIMHNRDNTDYGNFMEDVISDLKYSLELAKKAGIEDDRIIIDPGVGFAKSYEQNLEVIKRVDELKVLGYPVMLAASRKSVIGLTLDLPTEERTEGTIATSVIAVMKGCSFIRVHDIKENKRAVMMTEKVMR
ncbi:MAG: dihydropteroate synthase [Firmicutes bacterium]|nr:dihydropteroate synthase [Bacillota bacterium]